jgi:hypothetical protein
MKFKDIIRVALITLALLLIPLVLQLTIGTGVDGQGFNWTLSDFVIIGSLIFIAGLFIDWARRRAGKYRVIAITLIVVAFLWLWAELAVGLFTNWGS